MSHVIDFYELSNAELKLKYALYDELQSKNWKDEVILELIGFELNMRGITNA